MADVTMSRVEACRMWRQRHGEVIGELSWLVANGLTIGADTRPENVSAIVGELREKAAALYVGAANCGDIDLLQACDSLSTILRALPRNPIVADRIAQRTGVGGRAPQ